VVATKEYTIAPHLDLERIKAQLAELPGVREVIVEPAKRIAFLKVNLARWDEQRARQLIEGGI
jgi:copper chaperone CopZ